VRINKLRILILERAIQYVFRDPRQYLAIPIHQAKVTAVDLRPTILLPHQSAFPLIKSIISKYAALLCSCVLAVTISCATLNSVEYLRKAFAASLSISPLA
jgi:hypothetical protein